MNKKNNSSRIIATFFLLIFFPTIFPVNLLYAGNNGPNAYDSTSFEPVDAVDMVNLVTGDMSYVLPLINIPSPEGGYPLALSYHSGIAMDQESSWVGLGWSLTPGAINRNVNGYADDIELGNQTVFSLNQGEINTYEIGVGGKFMGISIGLGAHWDSNKTFGGTVSMGYGFVGATVGADNNGNREVRAGANTDPAFNSEYLEASMASKSSAWSKGSIVGKTSVVSGSSYGKADSYDVTTTSTGIDLNYIFRFYYKKHKTKYSLFNQTEMDFMGSVYPIGKTSSQTVYGRNGATKGADSNSFILFDNSDNIFDVIDSQKSYLHKNVVLPATDSYIINAQGLNGAITPVFTDELPLYHTPIKGKESAETLFYYGYNANSSLSDPEGYFAVETPYTNLNHNLRLNNKIFFEFNGDNSSYLRIDRNNVIRNTALESSVLPSFVGPEIEALVHSSSQGGIYNENSLNGVPLKVGNRKRTGKFIESFTNKQILTGNSATNGWFIHPSGLNRTNSSTYLPESIGGFRVTDTDGKVYHYSLPVINFEIWYKNFTDVNNEYNGFTEQTLTTPYATDWLLTAVTGPDYVDVNGNNTVDEGDYGYWVDFEYGKWTDGYIWQSSSGDYDIVNEGPELKQTYEYYRGRKQVYYLDAVKTRTHTAYFIKSLRDDSLSKQLSVYQNKTTQSAFNAESNSMIMDEPSKDYYLRLGYHPDIKVDDLFKGFVDLTYAENCRNGSLYMVHGSKRSYKYYDFPKHYSLKLDKIVLVKNNTISVNKNSGQSTGKGDEAFYFDNVGFKMQYGYYDTGANNQQDYCGQGIYYRNTSFNSLKKVDIHLINNVLDVADVNGINIEANAEKVINFNYDYSNMPSSPNSIATNQGKLTLKDVAFLGKKGASYLPPYKFNYKDSWVNFDVVNEDGWGYNRTNPTAWNLSEITTPLGSRMNIDYEQDDYSSVAAKVSRLFKKGLEFYIWKNDPTNELYFSVTKSTNTGDLYYPDFKNVTDCFTVGEKISLDMFLCRRYRTKDFLHPTIKEVNLDIPQIQGEVVALSPSELIFKLPDSPSYWTKVGDENEGWIFGRKISLVSVKWPNGDSDHVEMQYSEKDRYCKPLHKDYDKDDFSVYYTLASSNIPKQSKGGGLRVKSVSVYDNEADAVMSKRNYHYNKPGYSSDPLSVDYISSGVTSFAPSKEDQIIPYASELPPPIVMYGNVTVEECGKYSDFLQKTQYSFETLEPYSSDQNSLYKLGNHLDIKQVQNEQLMSGKLNLNKCDIESKFNYLGRLLSVKTYNSNNHLISSAKNNYYSADTDPDQIGTKQEAYISKYWHYDPLYTGGAIRPTYNYVSSATKTWYPSKLEYVSQFNGGYTSTVYYENYDFLTGNPLDQKLRTSDGKTIKLSSVPAYKKYAAMGAKVDNVQNKNMLTQRAVNYSFLYDDYSSSWGVTGVGMTRWNNSWSYKDMAGDTYTQPGNTWRKSQTFIYKGNRDENGVYQGYNLSNDQGFVWTGTSSPSLWLNTSTITLYDNYSNALEIKDINGNYASKKMGDSETKVMATGNARYTEMYYAGAETIDNGYWLEPEVRLDSGTRTSVYAHTGKYSVAATSATQFGVYMRSGQHRSGAYKLSVWVHKNNAAKARVRSWSSSNVYEFNGESVQAGDWVLKTHYFYDVTTADFYPFVNSVDGTTVYFDDLRIHPIASNMTSYVYNEWDELTHVIGTNNLAVKYEYDDAGRLVKTYVEVVDNPGSFFVGGFKLNSANKYNNKIMSK